ncbi:hypothetical protein GCM10011579_072800 [Streptomyces albiflavescens]|uniref:Uncharacterized protein n=1 Tax=Streptomyces albiflavescens TaxID=1623582 RepID=A0A917YAI9_9ACTN|nr:hypothetical protein GCM10011579_072800 [Streptomyces albiflavescens]
MSWKWEYAFGAEEAARTATRKEFVYGEDVTIADWTISTEGLPRYPEG